MEEEDKFHNLKIYIGRFKKKKKKKSILKEKWEAIGGLSLVWKIWPVARWQALGMAHIEPRFVIPQLPTCKRNKSFYFPIY